MQKYKQGIKFENYHALVNVIKDGEAYYFGGRLIQPCEYGYKSIVDGLLSSYSYAIECEPKPKSLNEHAYIDDDGEIRRFCHTENLGNYERAKHFDVIKSFDKTFN